MIDSILDVRDLVFSYGDRRVLDGVTFGLRKGEFLGILGPNASGKTTVLRCVAGTLTPKSGRVTLMGEDVSSIGRRDLARMVAVVAQDARDLFDLTVEEFVAMGRLPHLARFSSGRREDREMVRWAMREARLEGLGSRPISGLSGGERQRAAVARALAQGPGLLILDEPTSHLDICQQIDVMDLIKGLSLKTGLTVMAVLHDLNLASGYCDSVVLLSRGVVLAAGRPAEVLTERAIRDLYGTQAIVIPHPDGCGNLVVPRSRLAARDASRGRARELPGRGGRGESG